MVKLFLESDFQRKGNKQRKKTHSQQNLVAFSAATDSEIIIIKILHGKGQIKNWTGLSSLGQEPTFKAPNKNCRRRHFSFSLLPF